VAQRPLDGASLLRCVDDPAAPAPRDTQYFEMVGSRAIYHQGWKATTDHVGNQVPAERALVHGSHDFEKDRWSLFRLDDDFAETRDLAAAEPARAAELERLWWREAERNQVLPLEDGFVSRAAALVRPPFGFRTSVELTPGADPVTEDALPPLLGGFALRAEVELADARAQGIVAALGDWTNGWALWLADGRPTAALNLCGDLHKIVSSDALAPGRHALAFEVTRDRIALVVDGAPAAEAKVTRELPLRWQIGAAGLVVGRDRGFPVCDDYAPPFPFTEKLHRVVLEIAGRPARDGRRELAAALRHE
jgi:hypothetical protein